MFEGLKKKFSNFIGGLTKKEEVKEPEKVEQPEKIEKEEVKTEEFEEEVQEEEQQEEIEEKEPEEKEEPRRTAEKVEPEKVHHSETPKEEKKKVEELDHKQHEEPAKQVIVEQPKPIQAQQPPRPSHHEEPKPAPQPKVSFTTRLKGVIFSHVKISEKDADPFIESLKIGLLESDVNYEVAEKITSSIRTGLVGKSVESRNIQKEITQIIRGSIMQVLSSASSTDIVKMIQQKRDSNALPFKIMFMGPNGAGKTTTMAKIANMLLANNITCVLSASDTFRAAAIEQTVHHAQKLGINVIKGNYGADPASIAFDAIAHAKAHGIMAVLIDSAGRQETNKSLIEELKKMVRVTTPDLKIFVGEAISGNALLEQVKAINEAVKLDGIILTKLDVDAKGGNTLSILSETTVPILFFGTGEKYSNIMPYDPQFIIDNILPNN